MLSTLWTSFVDVMRRGGPVMWPLLALSIISLTLVFERAWFWLHTNSATQLTKVQRMAGLLRQGDRAGAALLAQDDKSLYGRVVRALAEQGHSEALAADLVETERRGMERFMPTLATIITAGPLLGLLGTVFGLISTFNFLSNVPGVKMDSLNPAAASQGLAEALFNTAAGLLVAIVALFPYNAFRAQVDRTLGRLDTLIAAGANRQASTGTSGGTSGGASRAEPAAPPASR